MGNPKLEKLQRKSRDKDLSRSELSFTCNDPDVICSESPRITIENEGVRLHFLRYGLFDKATPLEDELDVEAPEALIPDSEKTIRYTIGENGEKRIALDEVVVASNPFKAYGMPNLKQYGVARTALNQGYIYLINENDPDEYYELAVDQHGMLSHILWEFNKDDTGTYLDVRTAEREKINYKIIEEGKQMRMAFSPLQWSRGYFDEINASPEKKEALMTLIDCSGFPKDYQADPTADLIPFHQVKAAFPKQHPYGHVLQENLDDILVNENAQDQRAQEGGTANDILEDMFITFHDPIAAANDICASIEREIDRLKAIMLSCNTGIEEETFFQKLRTDQEITLQQNDKAEQIKYMHTLAATTYRFIYDNPKLKEKYSTHKIKHRITTKGYNPYAISNIEAYEDPEGDYSLTKGISKEKIYKILGVEERRVQRECINAYRDDLGNFILADYYQDVFEVYDTGPIFNLAYTKEAFAEHLIALAHYPNHYDKDFDLISLYQPEKDIWLKTINESLSADTKVFKKSTKIMDTKGDVHEYTYKQHHGFLKKVLSLSGKIGKAYFQHGDKLSSFTVLKERMSWSRNFETGNAILKYRDTNLEAYMAEHKLEFKRIEATDAYYKTKGAYFAYEQTIHRNMGKLSRREMDAVLQNEVLDIELQNIPKTYHRQAKEIIKSPEFGSLVLFFEIVSLSYAVKKYNKEQSGLNAALLLGAKIKLGAATYQLIENFGVLNTLPKQTAFYTKIGGKTLKLVGSLITVLSSAKDAYRSAGVHDYDAAFAWGTATGVASIFLVAETSALVAELGGTAFFSLGFWPAAIVGGILITLYGIAIYLTDTEIEAYFKNFPLSNVAINPEHNEKPHAYIQRLYAHRQDTVTVASIEWIANTQYKKFTNFETAYVGLMDIITPGKLELDPIVKYIQKDSKTKAGYAKRFKGRVQFFQYFEHHEQLDLQLWFYPNGIGNPKLEPFEYRTEITALMYDAVINDNPRRMLTENMPSRFEFEFGIPDAYQGSRYEKGEVLALCRLKTKDGSFIPVPHKGVGRYLCVNAFTYNTLSKHGYAPLPGVVYQETERSNHAPLKINRTGYPITIVEENQIKNLTS